MRADQQLSVQMGGDVFQIACEDSETVADLRSQLHPWLFDGQGLPGFQISPPGSDNKLWVLLGSNASVLARSTERSTIVRILLRHLGAMRAPQPPSTRRLGAAAFAGQSGVVLLGPSLLRKQPPIERQLVRAGLSLIDSSFIQVNELAPDSLVGIENSDPTDDELIPAHQHPAAGVGPIAGLLWQSDTDPAEVSSGQVAHAVSSITRNGTHTDRIDFGISWSDKLKIHLVNQFESGSVVAKAAQLVG